MQSSSLQHAPHRYLSCSASAATIPIFRAHLLNAQRDIRPCVRFATRASHLPARSNAAAASSTLRLRTLDVAQERVASSSHLQLHSWRTYFYSIHGCYVYKTHGVSRVKPMCGKCAVGVFRLMGDSDSHLFFVCTLSYPLASYWSNTNRSISFFPY